MNLNKYIFICTSLLSVCSQLFSQNLLGTIIFEENTLETPLINRSVKHGVMVVKSNLTDITFESTNLGFDVEDKGNGTFIIKVNAGETYVFFVKANRYQNSNRLRVFLNSKEVKGYRINASALVINAVSPETVLNQNVLSDKFNEYGAIEITSSTSEGKVKIVGFPGNIDLPFTDNSIATGNYTFILEPDNEFVKPDTQKVLVQKDTTIKIQFDTREQVGYIQFISNLRNYSISVPELGEILKSKNGRILPTTKKYIYNPALQKLKYPAHKTFIYKATADSSFHELSDTLNFGSNNLLRVELNFEQKHGVLVLISNQDVEWSIQNMTPFTSLNTDTLYRPLNVGYYRLQVKMPNKRRIYEKQFNIRFNNETLVDIDSILKN